MVKTLVDNAQIKITFFLFLLDSCCLLDVVFTNWINDCSKLLFDKFLLEDKLLMSVIIAESAAQRLCGRRLRLREN